MKDPAVLFYFQDFLVGTEFMTDEEVGKYTRVLCHLADKGILSKSQILRICKTNAIPDAINEKLLIDETGNYYQKRMREEREKRINYSESRRVNRTKVNNKICKTHDKRMENEDEDENINEDISININEKKKKNTWRDDFQTYLTECKQGYKEFMEDEELLKTQQRLNPGINIKLSIEKGYINFWSIEAGWKHKKASRSKNMDWKATIINSIGINKVYYTKEEKENVFAKYGIK